MCLVKSLHIYIYTQWSLVKSGHVKWYINLVRFLRSICRVCVYALVFIGRIEDWHHHESKLCAWLQPMNPLLRLTYILFMTRSPAALLITTMPVVDATKASWVPCFVSPKSPLEPFLWTVPCWNRNRVFCSFSFETCKSYCQSKFGSHWNMYNSVMEGKWPVPLQRKRSSRDNPFSTVRWISGGSEFGFSLEEIAMP